MKTRLPVFLYRVLEGAVMLVTYLVLAALVARLETS